MGFRFSRRIRIAPGIRLNLSKSGISTSIGTRGAWMTFGRGRRRTTVGLPGTGLSYTETTRTGTTAPESAPADSEPANTARSTGWGWWLLLLAVFVAWRVYAA